MLFKISGVHPMYMLPLVVIALLFLDEAMSSVKHHQPVPASPVILDSPAYASSYSSSDVLEEELEASVPPETADEDSSPAEGEIPAWYSADAKYLLFQPSGGISNQRKILEWALRVCEILQRTCILPHVAPHTTWYYKYNEVPLTDLAAADLVYSVEDMPVPVVTLAGQTMHQFARGHESRLGGAWRVVDRSSLRDKRANPWYAAPASPLRVVAALLPRCCRVAAALLPRFRLHGSLPPACPLPATGTPRRCRGSTGTRLRSSCT
jgi:hypothetical protein